MLPPPQRALLGRLATRLDAREDFYLAGGTALALQLGHRVSRDFDLFSLGPFDVTSLRRVLEAVAPPLTVRVQRENTLVVEAMGTPISAFRYPYPLVDATLRIPGIPFAVAGLRDIAAMKISAIGQRGVKRDYVDLYWLCRRAPLAEWFAAFHARYPAVKESAAHYLKALQWFEEAEETPLPDMLEPVSWEDVKAFFAREAPALARALLHA